MSEAKPLKNALIKLGIVCICGILYSWGGMGFLPARRFIMPTVLVGGMFYFSRDWRCLPQLPLMMFSLSLGYGAEALWAKIIKRGIYGLSNGISSSLWALLRKKWLLLGFQTVLLISAFIAFGVWNPLPSARVEELFLGLLIPLIPLFSVKEI